MEREPHFEKAFGEARAIEADAEGHYSDESLARYFDPNTEPVSEAAATKHLAHCEACRQKAEDIQRKIWEKAKMQGF